MITTEKIKKKLLRPRVDATHRQKVTAKNAAYLFMFKYLQYPPYPL